MAAEPASTSASQSPHYSELVLHHADFPVILLIQERRIFVIQNWLIFAAKLMEKVPFDERNMHVNNCPSMRGEDGRISPNWTVWWNSQTTGWLEEYDYCWMHGQNQSSVVVTLKESELDLSCDDIRLLQRTVIGDCCTELFLVGLSGFTSGTQQQNLHRVSFKELHWPSK